MGLYGRFAWHVIALQWWCKKDKKGSEKSNISYRPMYMYMYNVILQMG